MKKKIVFLSYDFFGYEKEIIKLLKEYIKADVFFINALDYEYSYGNKKEKILNNLYYKPFLKKSLKEIMFNKNIKEKLDQIGEVDAYFFIRADKFNHEILEYIKKKNKPMYIHHWDSISFIKKQKNYLKYFDVLSTFDKKEAEEYNMKFIPNFYLEKNIRNSIEKEYEFVTIMKYDDRFKELEKIGEFLKKQKINYRFIVVTKEKIESDYIEIKQKYIPLEEAYKLYSKSKGIVEIGHTKENANLYQGGASFRLADSIGNRQKVITNYKFIEEYDIYNKNNIFILNKKTKKELKEFIMKEYEELKDDIYKKYSGKNWIESIFEELK